MGMSKARGNEHPVKKKAPKNSCSGLNSSNPSTDLLDRDEPFAQLSDCAPFFFHPPVFASSFATASAVGMLRLASRSGHELSPWPSPKAIFWQSEELPG
jgi:hypothetical protein